jgi:hypothetical protein
MARVPCGVSKGGYTLLPRRVWCETSNARRACCLFLATNYTFQSPTIAILFEDGILVFVPVTCHLCRCVVAAVDVSDTSHPRHVGGKKSRNPAAGEFCYSARKPRAQRPPNGAKP